MRQQRGDRGVAQTFVRQDAAPRATYVAPGYLFIGLLALVAGLILGLASLAPPVPRPINAGAGQFSAEAALPRVLDLLGDAGPHPIGTESNAAVRANLIAALEDL